MKLLTECLPGDREIGEVFSDRDQDAKTERRRQQNRRNAQAWS
jgi:hypothetical protein